MNSGSHGKLMLTENMSITQKFSYDHRDVILLCCVSFKYGKISAKVHLFTIIIQLLRLQLLIVKALLQPGHERLQI
jgi:hypothetical protein